MSRISTVVCICLVLPAGMAFGAAAAEDPAPSAEDKARLRTLPEGYIVYGTGDKTGDDGRAYGIYKIDMQETTPVKIAERGRAPMIHPSDPKRIVYSEPLAPGSDRYNIVVMDFDGANREVMTKSPMPNIMFVSWTDRGELVFTSSEALPVYNDPLNMYHMDDEGTVTHIPTCFTTSAGEKGGGIDGVFMFRDRVLLRHDYKVGMYEVDQDNLAAGVTRLIKIAGNWTCGVTPYPDWNGFIFNGTNHGVFIENLTDDSFTRVAVHDAPPGWANDFAWSNRYEWAVFTLEKTDDCSEDVYVYNVKKREIIRHTWVPCNTFPHNPDIWVGPYELTRVAKPVIVAEPYLVGDSVEVPVTCRTEGATVYYTLDGTDPTQQSTPCAGPVVVTEDSTTLTVRAFKDGLDPSRITSLTFYRGLLRKPENPSKIVPGISYRYYEGCLDDGGFDTLTPTRSGVLDSLCLDIPGRVEDSFAVVFTGYLSISESGLVPFALTSDDGSRLFVGDSLIIDNWGSHAAKTKWGKLLVESGLHAIRLEYSERTGGQVCELTYQGKDFAQHTFPASACFHEDPDAEPAIALLSPADAQTVSLGSTLEISWNYSEGADVVVEISTDDGKPNTYERLSRVISASGPTTFEWTVPDDPRFVTTRARIRLFDYNKIMIETVSPAFEITSSSAAVPASAHAAGKPYLVLADGTLRYLPHSPADRHPRITATTLRGRTIHLPAARRREKAFSLDLSGLENGIYIVTLEHGDIRFRTRYTHIMH